MIANKHLLALVFSTILAGASFTAQGIQVIQNGDFETPPVPCKSNQIFTNWLQAAGTEVSDAPVPISGSHSALLTPVGSGTAYQLISQTGNWQSDWDFEMDFACSDSGSATARSVNMNLYHSPISYTNTSGSSPNINLRVVDSQFDGFGDVQVYNGSAWVTVLTNVVSFSAAQSSLQVNHLKIVGHYYATNSPNYDLAVVNASGVTNAAFDLADWQGGAPAAGSTNGQLYRINLGSSLLASGNWYVVDNVSLTVAAVGQTPPSITSQPSPAQAVVYKGFTGSFTYTAQVSGSPLALQWLLNNAVIPGATNSSLTVAGFTTTGTYRYSLFASNFLGSVASSNVVLTVTNAYQTGLLSNIWSLAVSNVPYLTTGYTERGFAFNPLTTNLLLVSRYATPQDNIAVLDATSGNFKYFMAMGDVPQDVAGSTLGVSQIGVGDDGYVYCGSVTVSANSDSTPFFIWQWTDDGSNTVPVSVFVGDPGLNTPAAGLRWGDSFAVRGGGTNTEILAAPGSGTNVVLFTTADDMNFDPNILAISGVPSGFAQTGIAFGPGTNTFWAKMTGMNLYLVQFDLYAGTGTVLSAYSATNGVDTGFRNIGMDSSAEWLAGLSAGYPDIVEIYNIADLTNAGPVLADQELFSTANANNQTVVGPVGAVAFGTNCLFAFDGNNGIQAYSIISQLNPFNITGIAVQSGGIVLTWQSVSGHAYQLQSKDSLPGAAWSNVGNPIEARGTATSVTNAVTGTARFYRIQGR